MALPKTKFLAAIAVCCAVATCVSARCGGELPQQPQPGQSHLASILVNDPNIGQVERTFRIHLPAGYPTANDAETPLVLDFHGYAGTSSSQEYSGGLDDVADEDADGGFIVVHGDGYGNPSAGPSGFGSWNCSRSDGPFGPPCVVPRPDGHELPCYDTCPQCDPVNTCDWSACLDDIAFVREMVDYVRDNYCLDVNSIHMSGYSNGGSFAYYAASKLSDIVASIAPNSGTPFPGFGDVPPEDSPISIIDFHGLVDTVIPYDMNSPFVLGEGPANSTISRYYYYYEQKPLTLARFVSEYECASYSEYPTPMDGVNGWSCNIWSECSNGAEIVECTGIHGHWYPFSNEDPPHIGGTRILWDFMKRHRKI